MQAVRELLAGLNWQHGTMLMYIDLSFMLDVTIQYVMCAHFTYMMA